MKIIEKIAAKNKDFHGQRSPVIAFLGDSVTQGCFELFIDKYDKVNTVCETRNSYGSLLKEKCERYFPKASPIIINAGLSGGHAPAGAARLERDVLRFMPDLTVVCFGLNDCQNGKNGIASYTDALETIFERSKEAGSEVIFMTPNMMCNGVYKGFADERIEKIAVAMAEIQNGGGLDEYMQAAVQTAKRCGVKISDCYGKWKQLDRNGADIIALLSNRINHPTREMHRLFCDMLFDTMMN